MPFPNEHAARVKDPNNFQQDSFRRVNIATGVNAIMGKLKGSSSMTMQYVRFDKTKFTPAQAREWMKNHDMKVMLFEPASNENTNVAIRKAVGK